MAEWDQRLSVIWHCSYRELPDNTLSILQGASEPGGSSEEISATQRKAEGGRHLHVHEVDFELSSNNSQNRQLQQLISRFVERCST